MTFKASNIVPAKGYEIAKARAWKARQSAIQMSALLSANINAQIIVGMVNTLNSHKTELEMVKNIPGILQYAKDQEQDQAYDVAAEFLNLIALIDTAIGTIQTTPTNTLINDWTLIGIAWNTFTPAQTAGLKVDLDAIVAAVS